MVLHIDGEKRPAPNLGYGRPTFHRSADAAARRPLRAFYSERSEGQLMKRMEFDLLFRWFVGLGADEPVWDASTFSKNRDRLLEGDGAARFLATLLGAGSGEADTNFQGHDTHARDAASTTDLSGRMRRRSAPRFDYEERSRAWGCNLQHDSECTS